MAKNLCSEIGLLFDWATCKESCHFTRLHCTSGKRNCMD